MAARQVSTDTLVADGWRHGRDLRASRPDVSLRPDERERQEQARNPESGTLVCDFAGRYHPSLSIGSGGMGTVWLARQEALRRDIALKVAHRRLGDRQREQFQAEAACTAFLEHPNIVPVYDAGPDFIVMKRIEGDNLEDLLLRDRLRVPDMVDIMIKVCDAVSFAHSRGIIHRDIKPENIMVGRFGEVVLMDWGLALQIDPPPDGVSRAPAKSACRSLCAGTPGFMAPEMARGKSELIGYATDVFLLGATLYRCLSGRLPFDGDDAFQALMRSAENDWLPVVQIRPDVPPRLAAIQERAMAEPPDERPRVADIQGVLRDWLMSANAETEAKRCYQRGEELLRIARAAGRRSDEAYAAYSEALAYIDRAVTLCPDRLEHRQMRDAVVREFTWAAASAGEPGLARLLKRSGRLPSQSAGLFGPQAAPLGPETGMVRERDRLNHSLDEARRHLDAMGTRIAELEGRLSDRNQRLAGWRLAGSLVLFFLIVPLLVTLVLILLV